MPNFQDDFLSSRGFRTWYDLFKYIKSKGKFTMIIDEFPYLIESNPAIPSLFQKGWDEDLSKSGEQLHIPGVIAFFGEYGLPVISPLRNVVGITNRYGSG